MQLPAAIPWAAVYNALRDSLTSRTHPVVRGTAVKRYHPIKPWSRQGAL